MYEPLDVQPPEPPRAGDQPIPEVLPVRRGQGLLAWILIFMLVTVILVMHAFQSNAKDDGTAERISLVLMEMQARYLVGAAEFFKSQDRAEDRDQLLDQAQTFSGGTVAQRLRYLVLVGELAGPAEALDQLKDLENEIKKHNVALKPGQRELLDTLKELYTDYDAGEWSGPSVDRLKRAHLEQEMGWFGELALAPEEGDAPLDRAAVLNAAKRTFWTLIIVVIGGLVVAAGGGVLLIVFLIGMIAGSLRSGLREQTYHGGIYAETFALWMVLFLGLSLAADLAPIKGAELLEVGVAMLLSLVALAWPLARGITWSELREDIGWTAGRNPLLEPFIGIITYAMGLPLLIVGVIAMFILLAIQAAMQGPALPENAFEPTGTPSHPIVESLANGDWWGRFQVLFVAAIVAPIVEETMFRGVLYRNLRDSSRWLGFLGSVIFSGTLVSFVFAVIHPQGWVAVPALMALAYAFTIAREWRGTLIPSMVAHGLNNGLLMTMLIVATSK